MKPRTDSSGVEAVNQREASSRTGGTSSGHRRALQVECHPPPRRGLEGIQSSEKPPSATMVWPTIHPASSEQRKATTFARSSGRPRRFIGQRAS